MNLSRLATLAVFFMMVMSAFIAVPTYNVGADEHEDVEAEEECPFDLDNPDNPCNAEECADHESPDCYDFVMNYCETNDDPGCDEMRGDGDDFEPNAWHAAMTMESLEDWMVDLYAEMPVDWSDDTREGVSWMCADMLGTDEGEITEECFEHWMGEMFMEDDHDGEHHEDECPSGLTDEQCDTIRDCEYKSAILDCSRERYEICLDDSSFDFCNYLDSDDDLLMSIFKYQDGVMSAEDFVDEWSMQFGIGDEAGAPAVYDIQSFTIGEDDAGAYKLYQDFIYNESRTSPDFICGSGVNETVPFSWINDGWDDCEDGSDEQKYDDEGNEINWFDCHDGSEVWIRQVNDGSHDCADGEDEGQDGSWWGNVYLFSGILENPEDTTNLIAGVEYACNWKDEYEVDVECDEYAEVELSAGDYSILTTGYCSDDWVDNDGDGEDDTPGVFVCSNYGEYNHSLKHVDSGEVLYFRGEVYSDTPRMSKSNDFHDSTDSFYNFVLYDTLEITVGSGGFDGAITSVHWECYDYDEDGEYDDCWGADFALYLYEYSFDPENPYDNILGANDDSWDEDLDCPSDGGCGQSAIQVELTEGTYVVVTAGYSTHSQGYYVNHMVNRDGDINENWDGELLASYWDREETDYEVVQTVAYDGSVYDLAFEEFWNEAYEFEWHNNSRAVEEHFGSVADLYESYEDVLETIGDDCDGCTGNLDTMDAETSFDISSQYEFENWASNYDFNDYYFQFIDDNENGEYDSGEVYAVSSEGGESEGQEVLVEGDDRAYLPPSWEFDSGGDEDAFFMEIYDALVSYDNGEMTAAEAADSIVTTIYEADEAGLLSDGGGDDDGHEGEDGVYWIEWSYCEWEGDDFDGDTLWYCAEEHEEGGDFDDWWYYCEVYDDGEGNDRWVCTDDFGQSPAYESSAGNTYYKDGGRPDHEEYEDDNPAVLDGIAGVNDPEDPNFMPTPENMIGSVSDNEGSPMFLASSFKAHFDGVDDSLETHELYIPIAEDGEDWYAELFFLEGYELISCDVCEDLEIDGNEAKFRTDRPVIITFGMVEPLPDCDHVVGLDSTGYAFEPADLTINVGETVCWQWEGAADVHNVLELESEFDEDMNLTAVSVGFFSGEPSNTVDFRHTFTEDNMTHYYVCEPHATMGMVGKITVGEGSEEDPVQEIVEEAGLPSVGFVVSVLALIGVTGLRRRIH